MASEGGKERSHLTRALDRDSGGSNTSRRGRQSQGPSVDTSLICHRDKKRDQEGKWLLVLYDQNPRGG